MTPAKRIFGVNPFGAQAGPQSLGKPGAVYPTAVATDSDMIIAVDRQLTRLALPLNTTDTSMTVVDPSIIVPYCLLTIDTETVKVTGPPVGSVVPISRGFDGSTAALHLASALVSGFIDAYHHNRLVAEVEAIQQTLGANLSRIPSISQTVSTNFAFNAQTPGGNLVVGNNVITLSPVPQGVNGSNLRHYLYISGGTGAAEPVLITGGTAVSGAASGTVIVNCANAHSGPWVITSATAGMQEAVYMLPGFVGMVTVPAGRQVVYATTSLFGKQCIIGQGASATDVFTNYTGAPIFYTAGGQNSIRNLQIRGNNSGSNYAIQMYGESSSWVTGVIITQTGGGIRISGTAGASATYRVIIDDVLINYFTADGIRIENGADHFLSHLEIDGARNSSSIGIHVIESGGLWVTDAGVINCGNGMVFDPSGGAGGAGVNWAFIVNAVMDTSISTGIVISPSNGTYVSGLNFVNCWAASVTSGSGVFIGSSTGATVNGIRFIGHRAISNAHHGFEVFSGNNILLDTCTIAGNSASPSASAAYHGVLLQPGVSNFTIQNSTICQTDGALNTQGYGIVIVGGAGDSYIIAGNKLAPNATGSISDSGTGLNKVIEGNLGITNTVKTLAAAASLALGAGDESLYTITGTAQITTIQGGWTGRRITLIFTDAAPGGVGAGGNIGRAQTAAQNQSVSLIFSGTSWY